MSLPRTVSLTRPAPSLPLASAALRLDNHPNMPDLPPPQNNAKPDEPNLWVQRANACTRFGYGLGKLVLLGMTMLSIAGLAFNAGEGSLTLLSAWTGALAYMLGIYFIFSGGIDILTGLLAWFGKGSTESFVSPYHASSITIFWQRWAVPTACPLAETSTARHPQHKVGNMLLIIFVAALWHGVSWLNVLAWLALHGALLLWERWSVAHRGLQLLPNYVRVLLTFFVVMLTWVVFRTPSLDQALNYGAALCGRTTVYETALLLQARILTDYHLVTLVLGTCIVWISPPTNDWLRVVTRRKAIGGLLLASLAVISFFTH